MRSAELLSFGIDEPLSSRLAAWSQDRGLWYRTVQHESALRNLLAKGSRGILLLRIGRDLADELHLLRDVADEFAEVKVIAFGDLDHPLLEGLAYDLGATAVLFPPRGVDELFEMLTMMVAEPRTIEGR